MEETGMDGGREGGREGGDKGGKEGGWRRETKRHIRVRKSRAAADGGGKRVGTARMERSSAMSRTGQ